MGEAKVGEAFITHEYDESIAVQQCIVDAESKLATSHPVGSARTAIKAALAEDKTFLTQLKALGRPHGATGKIEDVAKGLKDLMEETLETATKEGADSDYYEAHAVLLNTKRKQMDSAGGMLEIARATKDTALRAASTAFAKAQKASCQALAAELAAYAARIATAKSPQGGGPMTDEPVPGDVFRAPAASEPPLPGPDERDGEREQPERDPDQPGPDDVPGPGQERYRV